MLIHWLDSVDSTQRYVSDVLQAGILNPPFAVVADHQTAGTGSRGNSWEGIPGNLFCSFAVQRHLLPEDLKLESASIYFAYLLKEVLHGFGSKVWLKWPNDFYVGEKKVGGIVTTLRGESLVCGIGLNLEAAPEGFDTIDINISRKSLMKNYFARLKTFPSWKQIFRNFALEFDKSRQFETHADTHKISLKNAVLCEDGTVECDGQRMYSLR